MRIVDSVLAIAPRSETSPARQPIDYFFRSLAADRRAMGIGVMLSPADASGVTGLQAIREKGGIAIVQNENSAGRTTPGIADLILSPAEIGDALERIGRTTDASCAMPAREARNLPGRILEIVKATGAVDFSFDKRDAVRRRILRRMKLCHCGSMEGYLTYLESSSSETRLLAEDLLTHATGSFRDMDRLASLGEVFSRQLQAHPGGAPFRVWVPGCSTGQAVYSIAMCLLEAIPAGGAPVPVEIFGTDLSEGAIATARAAVYPEADVARLSPERRERFFTSFGGNFRIVQSLREMCVFSQRHIASDPLLPPLDLISCRNLIACLETPGRDEIVATFHRALRPGGCVLLGHSDSLGGFPELFQQIDRQRRLYAKRDCPQTGIRIVHSVERLSKAELDSAVRSIVEGGPAWVLVDGGLNIIERHGDLSAYLQPGPTREGHGLLNAVRDEIRDELTSLLRRTGAGDPRVHSSLAQEATAARGGGKQLNIRRISASLANGDACCLIAFSRAIRPGEPGGDDLNTRLWNCNRELSRRNDDLVNLIGGTPIPVLIVDRELRIKSMTPVAERLFNLPPGHAGGTIGDLSPLFAGEHVQLRIRQVIDSGTPEEIELPDREGRFHLLRVQPCRSSDDCIEGAVLTLLDIDELRQARSAAVMARGFAEAILEAAPTPLLVLDSDLKVRIANGAFLAASALQPADVQNWRIDHIDKGQWGTPEFKGAVRRLLSGETAFEEFEFPQNHGAGKRAVLINARRVVWQGSARILIAIHDIAPQGRAEAMMAREKTRLERSARKTAAALHETEDALRQSRAELRALTGSLLHAQEEERRRVSRELHDDVSQDVVKLQFDIEALEQALPADRATEKRSLMAVRDDAARLSNDLRRIAHVLHPSTLDNLGLTGALSGYASDFSRRTGIPVEFTTSGVPDTIPQGIASAFYRITQEALRNIVRHSGAASFICLTGENSRLMLAIHDNGPGFDRQAVRGRGGLGLVSMEERARLIGASFQLDTAAGEGVTITLSASLEGAD
jgi:two-component system CheB/CheR fusion protein